MPVEVCEIVEGQNCRKKMEGDLTAKMIKQTLRTPVQRFEEIKCKLNDMIAQSRPYLDEFGIKIDTKAASVEARVLDPPTVVYKGSNFTPAKGSWNMIENKFFRGATIKNWQMINYGICRRDQMKRFADMLCEVGQGIGLDMAPAQDIKDLSRETRLGVAEILRRLKEKEKDLELVVIVVPSNALKSNYAEVKQVGDTKIGLITQCVQDKTVSFKCNTQVVSNILQKINTKMGGINNSIYTNGEKPKILEKPVIIFGADVTHPAPGDKVSPSVAAVVANLDGHPSRFATRVRVQKDRSEIQARVEMILELKDMVKELLIQFYQHVGHKPEKIIFYRDGVSEGQFLEVLDFEVSQIRKACTELGEDYRPPLTFIIVQKRHHTRFCPQDKRDGCGRPGNIPPGTTVDRKITHPKDYDFYLCSHYGQQGTSRPTHYTVLWDENNLSADDMQMLSYHLCHMYARCTRSISNPVPAQYAHLAAYRARDHLKVILDDSSSNDSVKQDIIEEAVKIVKSLQDKMYFI